MIKSYFMRRSFGQIDVQLRLADESAVRQAYLAISDGLGEVGPEVALQPMVQTGLELVVGVAHDQLFGSVVMIGLGGVHTDLPGDRSFRALPLLTSEPRYSRCASTEPLTHLTWPG